LIQILFMKKYNFNVSKCQHIVNSVNNFKKEDKDEVLYSLFEKCNEYQQFSNDFQLFTNDYQHISNDFQESFDSLFFLCNLLE